MLVSSSSFVKNISILYPILTYWNLQLWLFDIRCNTVSKRPDVFAYIEANILVQHIIKKLFPSAMDCNCYFDSESCPCNYHMYCLLFFKKKECKKTFKKYFDHNNLADLALWLHTYSYFTKGNVTKSKFLDIDFDKLTCWITGCYDFFIYSEHPWDKASSNIISCINIL